VNINATLLGQLISFIIFVWFCMKYIWPPLTKALQDRQKRIADGLAAAERGAQDKKLAQERAKQEMREAKVQAQEIIAQANKRAGAIVEESKDDARVEGERLLTSARAEIDQETNRAREQLRGQVAKLSIAGAEKILQREIDAAANKDIVDSVVSQL
jgi:F-type H+-transporting ATPase subunit b